MLHLFLLAVSVNGCLDGKAGSATANLETDRFGLSARGVCPAGWLMLPSQTYCIRTSSNELIDFDDMEVACNIECVDCHFGSISNVIDNAYIVDALTNATNQPGLLAIGLFVSNLVDFIRSWNWLDGSQSPYRYWCPGYPLNTSSCSGAVLNVTAGGCWQDNYCRQNISYLCGRPVNLLDAPEPTVELVDSRGILAPQDIASTGFSMSASIECQHCYWLTWQSYVNASHVQAFLYHLDTASNTTRLVLNQVGGSDIVMSDGTRYYDYFETDDGRSFSLRSNGWLNAPQCIFLYSNESICKVNSIQSWIDDNGNIVINSAKLILVDNNTIFSLSTANCKRNASIGCLFTVTDTRTMNRIQLDLRQMPWTTSANGRLTWWLGTENGWHTIQLQNFNGLSYTISSFYMLFFGTYDWKMYSMVKDDDDGDFATVQLAIRSYGRIFVFYIGSDKKLQCTRIILNNDFMDITMRFLANGQLEVIEYDEDSNFISIRTYSIRWLNCEPETTMMTMTTMTNSASNRRAMIALKIYVPLMLFHIWLMKHFCCY